MLNPLIGSKAREQDVDLEEVKRWSDVEGKLDEFEKIAENLRGNE